MDAFGTRVSVGGTVTIETQNYASGSSWVSDSTFRTAALDGALSTLPPTADVRRNPPWQCQSVVLRSKCHNPSLRSDPKLRLIVRLCKPDL